MLLLWLPSLRLRTEPPVHLQTTSASYNNLEYFLALRLSLSSCSVSAEHLCGRRCTRSEHHFHLWEKGYVKVVMVTGCSWLHGEDAAPSVVLSWTQEQPEESYKAQMSCT